VSIGSLTVQILCTSIKVPLCAHLSLPGTNQCDSRIPATPAAAFQVCTWPENDSSIFNSSLFNDTYKKFICDLFKNALSLFTLLYRIASNSTKSNNELTKI
jgi:hypothetical protein